MSVGGGPEYQAHEKWQLTLSSVSFNGRIGSNSPRKAARFVSTRTRRRLRYDDDYQGGAGNAAKRGTTNQNPGADWLYSDMVLQKVTRIDRSDLAVPVYDITVTGTASFIADGVLVHNTGIEQQQIGFLAFTLRPDLVSWEQRLTLDLIQRPDKYFVEFTLDGFMRADAAARGAYYRVMREVGAYSANDIRQLENMNPIENGDIYLQPTNLTPLGSTPPTPAPPQTGATQ
jgi:hypothetical protein